MRHVFDLIKEAFPFNMNIACIGRFGQGKSSGVNSIINEYKAKESSKGCSQTKNLTYYQIEGRPIRILDIPGFESEETVKKALEQLKFCGKKINKIKDNIHIILYFLNYSETKAFMELEYPILEEVINQSKNKSKLIYVITHSKLNPDSRAKKRIIDRINTGIYGITKNKPIQNKIGIFKADNNNVVFVNFYKDNENKIPSFGKYELFKKIHDCFIKSESYMNSKTNLSKEGLQDTIEHLKAEARQILLPSKIFGAAAGLIPFGDWLIQKFIIKKDAIMKIGSIFEIDIKYIEEDLERKKKFIEKYKKSKIETYRTPEIDENNLINADYNKLKKESFSSKVQMTIKNTTQASAYAKGAIDIASNASSSINNVKTAWENVNKFEMLYSIKGNSGILPTFPTEKLLSKYIDLLENAAALEEATGNISKMSSTASVASKALGLGSVIIGVAAGGYFTHKFCEEKINQFA